MNTIKPPLPVAGNDCPVWIRVGCLLDGVSPPKKDVHLVYDAEKIRYVGAGQDSPPAEMLRAAQTAPDAVLEDCTVLPGLIDGHTHIFLQGAELDFEKRKAFQNQKPRDLLISAEKRCRNLLPHGIIAMRDGGDKDGVGLALCKSRGKDIAAEVYSPGPGINRLKRYGSFFCEPYEDFLSASDVVDDRIGRGADHIKIVPTGIINFAKAAVVAPPQYSAEEIAAICDVAHTRGKHVMAHASGAEGIGMAIEGGVDTIEHGYFIRDSQLERMLEKGCTWVPTFAPVQKQVDHADQMGWNALERENLQRILDHHAASLRKGLSLGVRILVGSDAGSCGVGHAEGLFVEMERMEQAGMPTLSVLNACTGGNREVLVPNAKMGRIASGMKPRFLITQHDPLKSVSELRKSKWVVVDGQIFSSDQAVWDEF
jgi:imidazolonepropionase-like amidohydrolase